MSTSMILAELLNNYATLQFQMEGETIDSGSIEKQMMEVLKYGGLQREHLSELVRIASEVTVKSGLRLDDYFPLGMPLPDLVGFRGTLKDRQTLSRFVEIVSELDMIREFNIWRYGQPPHPSVFMVDGVIGKHGMPGPGRRMV